MPSDGLFNVAIVLVRALARYGSRSREDLLAACGLGVDGIDPKHLTQTLNRWTELGLFQSEDKLVSLRDPYRSILGKNPDIAESRLPKVLRMIALAPENNIRFFEAEENRAADLNRGLSWILAQDVYTIDTSSHGTIDALENSQVADKAKRMLQNDTRWNGLRTWMVYLGFARSGSSVTIDPTQALRESLDEVFGAEQTLAAPLFVDRIAEVIPVLDGGLYRRQIEDLLKGSTWHRPPASTLSTALSRAIRRLIHEGVIATEQLSDTEAGVTLVGAEQRPWLRMTHVRWIANRKAK
ncbi:protein DpdG [Devosia aquimaris]|uniref:protein DpdG n=1 Tax=Devosia aquimaris TaxID=2866214 RepID=UPI0021E4AA95|nr:protein DpdG [Devosia sp. CJK-A8-3]